MLLSNGGSGHEALWRVRRTAAGWGRGIEGSCRGGGVGVGGERETEPPTTKREVMDLAEVGERERAPVK